MDGYRPSVQVRPLINHWRPLLKTILGDERVGSSNPQYSHTGSREPEGHAFKDVMKDQGKAYQDLVEFCQYHSITFNIEYWSAENNVSATIGHPNEAESHYFVKRCYDLGAFLEAVKNKWREEGLNPAIGFEYEVYRRDDGKIFVVDKSAVDIKITCPLEMKEVSLDHLPYLKNNGLYLGLYRSKIKMLHLQVIDGPFVDEFIDED